MLTHRPSSGDAGSHTTNEWVTDRQTYSTFTVAPQTGTSRGRDGAAASKWGWQLIGRHYPTLMQHARGGMVKWRGFRVQGTEGHLLFSNHVLHLNLAGCAMIELLDDIQSACAGIMGILGWGGGFGSQTRLPLSCLLW